MSKVKTIKELKTKAVKVKVNKPLTINVILSTNPIDLPTEVNYIQTYLKSKKISIESQYSSSNGSGYALYLFMLLNKKIQLDKEINFKKIIGKKAGTNFRKFSKAIGYSITKGKNEKSKRFITGTISKI